MDIIIYPTVPLTYFSGHLLDINKVILSFVIYLQGAFLWHCYIVIMFSMWSHGTLS